MANVSIPGVYDALDTFPGQPRGMSKGNTASQNQVALQAAVDYAISQGGGIVLIPSVDNSGASGPYKIQSTGGAGTAAVSIPSTAPSLLISGTGLGSKLLMENSGDVFDITGANNIAFQDLTIIYDQTNVNAPFTGTGINYMGCQNCYLFRLNFTNCQQAVTFTQNSTGTANTIAYMLDCFVLYDSNYPKQTCTGVQIAHAAETFVTQCTLRSTIATANVQSGQVGVSIGDSSYAHLLNLQIENFYTGIELGTGSGTAKGSMFTNVRVAAIAAVAGQGVPVCLSINPNVYDARFIGCHFQNPPVPPNASGQNIVINPSSSGNSSIDTVIFDSCTSKTSVDHGLQIAGGQNIQILGGVYSGNTTAGIAITGSAQEIQIIGANCLGPSQGGYGQGATGAQKYGIYITSGSDIQIVGVDCSGTGNSLDGTGIYISGTSVAEVRISDALCVGSVLSVSSQQQYGIYVNEASGVVIDSCYATGSSAYGIYLAAVTDVTVTNCDLYGNTGSVGMYVSGGAVSQQSKNVFIRGCNITGYGAYTNAIQFAGVLVNVQVTDCSGYNDQKPALAGPSVSPPSGTFSGLNYHYYGPVAFYYQGGSGIVTIDGNSTGLASGGFTLSAGENASISNSTGNFLMVGK